MPSLLLSIGLLSRLPPNFCPKPLHSLGKGISMPNGMSHNKPHAHQKPRPAPMYRDAIDVPRPAINAPRAIFISPMALGPPLRGFSAATATPWLPRISCDIQYHAIPTCLTFLVSCYSGMSYLLGIMLFRYVLPSWGCIHSL